MQIIRLVGSIPERYAWFYCVCPITSKMIYGNCNSKVVSHPSRTPVGMWTLK